MSVFKNSMPNDDINVRMNTCYHNIKIKIINQCGIADIIEKDGWIAFSGSIQKPELLLTLSTIKTDGKHYLYADLDDEVNWQEGDFANQDEFENAIVEYISPLVNRTIKRVTEKKKHKYIKTSRYYLNDNNQWILIDEDVIDFLFIRLFITKDCIKEKLKSYQIIL
ncbi:MAG: hypothetical protein ACI3XR_09645 [Eubacteriales bacterium]